MLPRLHKSLEKGITPVIYKTVEGRDVTTKGAFPLDTPLCFCVKCPRALGARAVVIRWEKDGEAFRDYRLSFTNFFSFEMRTPCFRAHPIIWI